MNSITQRYSCIIHPDLIKAHSEDEDLYASIAKQMNDDELSRGAHLERLQPGQGGKYPLYSLRLNRSIRLILTVAKVNGISCPIFLYKLMNHKYENTIWMDQSYFTQAVDNLIAHEPALLPDLNSSSSSSDQGFIESVELNHYDRHYIQLNGEQETALKAPLPLIVRGLPGSGKSCLALLMLKNALSCEDPSSFLYVTASSHLVKEMQLIWQDLPKDETPSCSIDFKTYDQLIGRDPSFNQSEFKTFSSWFEAYLRKNDKIATKTGCEFLTSFDLNNSLPSHLKESKNLNTLVYQEMRMMSAFDKKSYLEFSQKERLFTESSSSSSSNGADAPPLSFYDKLYACLESYKRYLEDTKQIDPSLAHEPISSSYTRVFVDETQDFSSFQLLQLANIVKEKQIVYFIDSHQSLHDHFSKIPSLKKIIPNGLQIIDLPYTFRCSKAVASLANDILSLKHHVTGGVLEKNSVNTLKTAENASEGSVYFSHQLTESEKKDIQKKASKVAMICHEDQVEKLQEELPGSTILTPSQAKGLEYEVVIVHHLIEHLIDTDLNKLLEDFDPKEAKQHRPKENDAHHEYAPPLTELFTSVTRAQQEVYILHSQNTHDYRHFINAIKASRSSSSSSSSAPLLASLTESSQEEILDQIKILITKNRIDPAQHLYQNHINSDPKAFDAFCQKIQVSNKDSSSLKEELKLDEKVARLKLEEKKQKETKEETSSLPRSSFIVPVSEKQKEFLKTCSLNRSKNNLKAFLTYSPKNEKQKGATVATLLFHEPLDMGVSFFSSLLNSFEMKFLEETAKEDNNLLIRLFEMGCDIADKNDDPLLKLSFVYLEKRPVLFKLIKDKKLINQWKKNTVSLVAYLASHLMIKNNDLYTQTVLDLLKNLGFITKDNLVAQHQTETQELGPSLLHIILWKDSILKNFPMYQNNSYDVLDLTLNYLDLSVSQDGPLKGMNLLYCLLHNIEGISWFRKNFKLFKPKIEQQLLKPQNEQNNLFFNESPLAWLCQSIDGIECLKENWGFFSVVINKNPSILFRVCTDEGDRKGTTPFYLLCGLDTGLKLLKDHWDFFAPLIQKEPKALSLPFTAEGKEKGKTPFYWLCGSNTGRELLKDHWDLFALLIQQQPQLLSLPCTGEGEEKGITPFYLLCALNTGLKLLKDYWGFFSKRVQEKPQLLSLACTGEGKYKGITPFYWLCGSNTGRELLKDHWDFFASMIQEKPELLSLVCTGEGQDKGKTPFYFLCGFDTGRELLKDHWDLFAPLIQEQPQLLSLPCTGEGKYKGITPFYWLCGFDTGIELLKDHWNDFALLIRQNPQLLSLPCTAEGEEKGKTPFHYLCGFDTGIELLKDHWNDFALLIRQNPQLLSLPCTAEGEEKGITPFYLLCGSDTGLKLVKDHWDLFAFLIQQQPQLLSLPCTGEGKEKGTTPFYWLCASNTGRELVKDHWDLFASLIQEKPQLLSLPCTGEGEEKGTTPFYWLCASNTGLKLLKDHWNDFAVIIQDNPKILFTPCESEGACNGTSAFYWLCSSDIGIEILTERKEFFCKIIEKDNSLLDLENADINARSEALLLKLKPKGKAILDLLDLFLPA